MEDIAQVRAKRARIDAIVDARLRAGNFRHEVAGFVPRGAKNILDYGFGDGSLLLWLRREKHCTGLYGVEVDPGAIQAVDGLYDRTWLVDLNREDAHLGPEYEGFFSHILMPMSLEHTYDPWFVLKKMNRYLAPGGSIIVEVPNAQSWECAYRLLTGDFPYVSGGTWDFSHIRWYTLKSLADLGHVCGFRLTSYDLLFPGQVDLEAVRARESITSLELPPRELQSSCPRIRLEFPVDIKEVYPLLLAHVLIARLEKVREPEDHEPTARQGYLESYRVSFRNPAEGVSGLIPHPICPPLAEAVRGKAQDLLARGVS
ncbi:Methyltransferase domain-containing protein [Humidesulfovibrio mexicanus]|uniref:Methyltransferase domain-containing protein n=1 Tax=Humidesulfovibrio mexicanus TaxID=147047 RepID=A0A239A8M3_9BACT|nr:class I SAM-dependent methyltransferase [Humidesulfovibrio mexicanus]SNR91920.1 Methyltransferase domain-containing protein [Humidesulfovibrio mexicanus]